MAIPTYANAKFEPITEPTPKFVQIALGPTSLYALDDRGRIWTFERIADVDADGWRPVPATFFNMMKKDDV